MSLYVTHMDHPTGFCGLIQADHSLFSPRCVPSQLSSLISVEIPCSTTCQAHGHPTGFCGLILADRSLFSPRCVPSQLSSLISVEIPCVTICQAHGSSYWILWPNPGRSFSIQSTLCP